MGEALILLEKQPISIVGELRWHDGSERGIKTFHATAYVSHGIHQPTHPYPYPYTPSRPGLT